MIAAALLCLEAAGLCAEIAGRVVAVHDGDTITVLTPDKTQFRVRLQSIDAPELKQAFGNNSKRELSRVVFGKQVRVEEQGKDQYDRVLGQVYAGPTWVNEAQVKAGMAWVYLAYSSDPRLVAAEKAAQDFKRGLWKDKAPAPPWDWRRTESQGGGTMRSRGRH
jgi:endonuclease YncB( thermonuclease family)